MAIRTNNPVFNAALLSVLLVAISAGAADEVPTSTPQQAEAAKLFEEAMRDYDRADHLGAIARLQAAQLVAPHHKVLYNLAALLDLVGRRAEAYRHFEQYLEMAGDQIDEPQRNSVKAKLNELERSLARIRIEARPAATAVLLNGKPFDASTDALVDVGTHSVRATAPGFEASEVTLTVRAGETQRVFLTLAPAAVAAAAPAPAPSEGPRWVTERQRSSHPATQPSAKPSPWIAVLLGSGGALLAGSLTAHLARSARNDDWEAAARKLDAVPGAERNDAYWSARANNAALAREIRHLDGVRLGLLVGAGALVVAGTGLWITSTPSRDATTLAYRHVW